MMRALGQGSVAAYLQIVLTIAWWLLWAIGAALIAAALAYGGVNILIAQGMIDPEVLTGGAGHIRVNNGGGTFDLDYDEPGGATWPVVVPALLAGLVAVAGGLVIVDRLRKLFESFTSSEPFRKENADHLRAIWIALLIIELARYALLALTGVLLAAFGAPDGQEANFDVRINLSTWVAILILIVLAEVFREGARLREEQDLTI